MNSEHAEIVAKVFTEGKTDWQHLKKAKERLQIKTNIHFHEEKGDMGDSVLLHMCRIYNKLPQSMPYIFIFDRDKPNIIKDVSEKGKSYKDWGNNVFSFAIPEPDHRTGYENISIELYYTDDEIRTEDIQQNRLFLSSEFDEKSGNHKNNATIHVGDRVRIKHVTADKKAKIVDRDIGVFDENNQNMALSKADFASYICNDSPPFNTFDFEPFRKIFSVIEEILLPSPKNVDLRDSSAQRKRPEIYESAPKAFTINPKDKQRQDQMIELIKLSQKHGVDIDSLLRLLQAEKDKTLFTRRSNIQQIIKQEIQHFRGES